MNGGRIGDYAGPRYYERGVERTVVLMERRPHWCLVENDAPGVDIYLGVNLKQGDGLADTSDRYLA